MNISLFCSSSQDLSPVFYSEAECVGRCIGRLGHRLYFGASDMGLMKSVSEEVVRAGSEVVGVTTEGLNKSCRSLVGLKELIVCEDLNERKKKLIDFADVLLILPGGIGTLDELFDILAAKQVGESDKPVILYDSFDYWSGLVSFFTQIKEMNMITQNLSDLYTVVDSIDRLVEVLSSYHQ